MKLVSRSLHGVYLWLIVCRFRFIVTEHTLIGQRTRPCTGNLAPFYQLRTCCIEYEIVSMGFHVASLNGITTRHARLPTGVFTTLGRCGERHDGAENTIVLIRYYLSSTLVFCNRKKLVEQRKILLWHTADSFSDSSKCERENGTNMKNVVRVAMP